MQRALELLQQAVALDASYAHAHALMGWIYVSMFNLDARTPIGEFTDKALEVGAKAVTLDDQEPWGHLVLGLGHARRRRPELALSASVEVRGAEPELRAGPCRARICIRVRRPPGARAAGSQAGAPAEPARSVSRDLFAHGTLHGAVRARTL